MLATDLLLADVESDSILRFDGDNGTPLGAFVTSGSGGLVDPHDPTFGPDGDLFVFSGAGSPTPQILKFDGDTGAFIDVFVDTGVGGFNGGSAMEFGPDGNLYVATNTTAGVLRFDGDTGASLGVAAAGNGIRRAAGLDFGHDGNLLVLDSDGLIDTFADRIVRFDLAGNFVDQFVDPGAMDDVAELTVGPDGHLYVPEVGLADVRRFSGTTGSFLGLATFSAVVDNPIFATQFGTDGNIYASTPLGIERFDGETMESLGTFIDGTTGLLTFFPTGPSSDLEVSISSIPATAFLGEDFSVSYTVTNSSSVATVVSQWTDVVYLSLDNVFDPLDVELGRIEHNGMVAAGANYSETLTAPVSNILPGEYTLFVVSDRRGEVADSNRASNFAQSIATTDFTVLMTDVDPAHTIAVGRSLSQWSRTDVVGNELTITYTVYNLTPGYVDNVHLQTELSTGVNFTESSQTPDTTSGSQFSWLLGDLGPLGSSSISVTVSLDNSLVTQLDNGTSASGFVNFTQTVSDTSLPVELRSGPIAAGTLDATLDADANDQYVRAKAAELNQNANEILSFMTSQIGYESYAGSLRGSRGTLWSNAGNSLDQASLMIALLRASGVPARYSFGTLNDALSRQLILSMYPEYLRIHGLIFAGVPVADPASNAQLLDETLNHYWVELDTGSGFVAADPSFAEAVLGQTFATSTTQFNEVADALRHKVIIRLNAESVSSGAGLLAGSIEPQVNTVLEEILPAVELAGRTLSVGHFVNQRTINSIVSATTITYSPYLFVYEADDDPTDDLLANGTDFQEVITSFPFGNQVLTGLFLTVLTETPSVDGTSSQVATFEKTLLDRIGIVGRQPGTAVSTNLPQSNGPAVTEADITTLALTPSEVSADALLAAMTALTPLRKRALDHVQRGLVPAGEFSVLAYQVAAQSSVARTFLRASDETRDDLARRSLVVAYADSVRVIAVSNFVQHDITNPDQLTFGTEIDVISNTARAHASPGQAISEEEFFNLKLGIFDSVLEGEVLRDFTVDDAIISTANGIIEAALDAGAVLVPFGTDNISQIETLDISEEARVRVTLAVANGQTVAVPSQMITINGRETIAWYEIDNTTKRMIAVSENGIHQGSAENGGLTYQVTTVVNTSAQGGRAAIQANVQSFAVNHTNQTIASTIAQNGGRATLDAIIRGRRLAQATLRVALRQSNVHADWRIFARRGINDGVKKAADGFLKQYKGPFDPPTGDYFASPDPAGQFENLGQGQPDQLVADMIPDLIFSIPFGGAELRSVFVLGVSNTTNAEQTVEFSFPNPPLGFDLLASVPELTIPAGATGEINIALVPVTGVLPAADTAIPFTVAISSIENPGITTEISETFVVPEIHGVLVTPSPATVSTQPGVTVSANVALQAVGNVADTVTLTAITPSQLLVGGLTSFVLQPGQSLVRTLDFTPQDGLAINSELNAIIGVDFSDANETRLVEVGFTVEIAALGAVKAREAAVALEALGNPVMSAQLTNLGIALNDLVQEPTSEIFLAQALAALDSIVPQVAANPDLADCAALITTARDNLAVASNPTEVQSAIEALGDVLDDFAAKVTVLARHNFNLSLFPNRQTARPTIPVDYAVQIQNVGSQTTTFVLNVTGVPGTVTSQFAEGALTIEPGQIGETILTLTQLPGADLATFEFIVEATADGADPELSRESVGVFQARREFVSVTDVTATPPFGGPGTEFNISASILNAVNREQEVLVSFNVIDLNDQVVFTSTPVPTTLTLAVTTADLDLGAFDSTGLAEGQYTIEVTVTDTTGQPIPGANGEKSLLIGTPITASLTTGPSQLPPGDHVVNNTLRVDAVAPPTAVFQLVGQLTQRSEQDMTAVDAFDVNVFGDIAYVATGAQDLVVDISDPSNPTTIRIFGFNREYERAGDFLVGRNTPSGGTGFSLYTVTDDPTNPNFVGSIELNYLFASDFILDDEQIYLSTNLEILQQGDITELYGDVISHDSNRRGGVLPDDVLFNTFGTTVDGDEPFGIPRNGGPFNMFGMAMPDDNTLYVTSTTAEGDNVTTDVNGDPAVGVVRIVDVTDPNDISQAGIVEIPGTTMVQGVTIDGNRAYVIGAEGGWRDPFTNAADIGPTGNIVVAVLDISDIRNPTVIGTPTVLNRAARGMAGLQYVADGKFVLGSIGEFEVDTPQLLLIDAADPANVFIDVQIDSPGNIRGNRIEGNLLYSSTEAGLFIYSLGVPDIPVTAEVQVPNGTGVEVVPGSFNIDPTQVIGGTEFDTLVWEFTLDPSAADQTITWDSTVNDLNPGETRDVTLGTTISFNAEGAEGQVELTGTDVFADQVISLDPNELTRIPGEAATYSVVIENPADIAVTYDLAVAGVDPTWVDIASQVTVEADGLVVVPLTLTSDPFTAEGDYGFIVSASVDGVSGSVDGTLTLAGEPIPPDVDPEAKGVVVQLTPMTATAGQGTSATFSTRVINVGSQTDEFVLFTTGLPQEFEVTFSNGLVDVPPGASNFRDSILTITPPPGTTVDDYPFVLNAVSTTEVSVADTTDGLLTVIDIGVNVDLTPQFGDPDNTYQLIVTNTGTVTETFDLSLAAPVALVAELATSVITLDPDESATVDVTVGGIDFAFPGGLPLVAAATSQTNPDIIDADSSTVFVGSFVGLEAKFERDFIVLPDPGSTSLLLLIDNLGNLEDNYSATIVGTTGPLNASMNGLDGLPTQSIPIFRLPGLASGALLLNANLFDDGEGTVTVMIQSNDNELSRMVTATILAEAEEDNVPPVITSFMNNAVLCGDISQNGVVSISAGFSDDNVDDAHTAMVDWGDGSPLESVALDPETGAISGSHVYTSGGVFEITLTVTDTAGESDTLNTTALVTGVGLHDNVLHVIGTELNDHVNISKEVTRLTTRYNFRSNNQIGEHRVPINDVHEFMIILCGGEDHVLIGPGFAIPSLIDTGNGDSHVNAGEGDDIILGGDDSDHVLSNGGNDFVRSGGGVDHINTGTGNDIIYAGSGADHINSGQGDDIIVADNGNDHVDAGPGRDLIVGGLGLDRINGGSDDDILVPGTTNHDNDLDALLAIQQEWLSDRTFAERRDNLFDGSGTIARNNGDTFLDRDTVQDDVSSNQLTTGGGQDWRVNFSDQAGVTTFQNKLNIFDVNDEGLVTIVDALMLVDQLRGGGSLDLRDLAFGDLGMYADVNGDNLLTLNDALSIIRELRDTLSQVGFGEGESADGAIDELATEGEFDYVAPPLNNVRHQALLASFASVSESNGSGTLVIEQIAEELLRYLMETDAPTSVRS